MAHASYLLVTIFAGRVLQKALRKTIEEMFVDFNRNRVAQTREKNAWKVKSANNIVAKDFLHTDQVVSFFSKKGRALWTKLC